MAIDCKKGVEVTEEVELAGAVDPMENPFNAEDPPVATGVGAGEDEAPEGPLFPIVKPSNAIYIF